MADWKALARALRELHAALLRRTRTDYMRARGIEQEIGPGELLMLATRDEGFAWLRTLSELMTDIDYLRDDPAMVQGEALQSAVRGAVEQLLAPPSGEQTAGSFGQRYWQYVHDEPEVTSAHGAVRQALADWPAPSASGRSELTQHRQALTAQRRS